MKTVIIFDQCGAEEITFFVVDGDLRELNNIYINCVYEDEQGKPNETKLIWQKHLQQVYNNLDLTKQLAIFPIEEVKQGAFVIVCGFIP